MARSLLISVLALIGNLPCASAADFSAVMAEVDAFRKGDQRFFRAFFDDKVFRFMKPKQSPITEQVFDQLAQELAATNGPLETLDIDLRAMKNVTEVYRLSPVIEVERSVRGDKTTITKLEYEPIASYPLDTWPEFLEAGLKRGLLSCSFDERGGEAYARLVFARREPKTFGSQLAFNDAFYSLMRTAERYPLREPRSNKFIVLVHEPHWHVEGHYQLIDGLHALMSGNPNLRFRFLVEGLADSKDISAKGLSDVLSSDARRRRVQILQLVQEFLIDSPMAYRLLYNLDLPTVAIDDQAELKERTPRKVLPGYEEVTRVFDAIEKKVKARLSTEELKLFSQMLATIRGNTFLLFISQMTGPEAVAMFEGAAESVSALADLLTEGFPRECNDEILLLEGFVAAFKSEVRDLQKALRRDKTMVAEMMEHFASPVYASRVPIAFIGSFHTAGILAALPDDVGYIVIEPRIGLRSDKSDQQMFQRSLIDYEKHLDAVLAGREKLRVAPPKHTIKKLGDHAEGIAQSRLRGPETGLELFRPVFEAVSGNGHFRGAEIQVMEGGSGAPPGTFAGAIARYEPTGRGKLALFKRSNSPPSSGEPPAISGAGGMRTSDPGWERGDRVRYFRSLVLPIAPEKASKKGREVTFQQDPETRRIFFTVFDPESRSYYFFEAESLNGSKVLELPPTKNRASIHMQLSDNVKVLTRAKAA